MRGLDFVSSHNKQSCWMFAGFVYTVQSGSVSLWITGSTRDVCVCVCVFVIIIVVFVRVCVCVFSLFLVRVICEDVSRNALQKPCSQLAALCERPAKKLRGQNCQKGQNAMFAHSQAGAYLAASCCFFESIIRCCVRDKHTLAARS